MKDTRRTIGLKKNIIDKVHSIMLVAILHSSFIAPSQTMLSDYFNLDRRAPLCYNGSRLNEESTINSNNQNNNNTIFNGTMPLIHNNKTSNTILFKKNPFSPKAGTGQAYYLKSDIDYGFIGVSKEKPLDDPADNLFKFYFKDLPQDNAKAFLTYEVYGVQDCMGVSRSINDRLANGGYMIKNQPGWSSQKEEINTEWLKTGENRVMFGIPKGSQYSYQIKNVKIEIEPINDNAVASILVLNSPKVNYIKDNKLYVKGFIRNAVSSTLKVYIEDSPLTITDGEYEGFLTLTEAVKNRKFAIIKAFDSSGLLGQEILSLDFLNEADQLFNIEKLEDRTAVTIKAYKNGSLKGDGASISIKDSTLTEDKEISIIKLRSVDIAPMASGMINVTKGGYAYRFLPDGTKFSKPVSLSIDYDEQLIPKGYSPNDIKTFYFNTDSKSWVAVKRDTIDKKGKSIISLTNHFTDYVNGIIQAPESPETAGFTPTMMNDIKAADPASEMTIISPPEVSQKGDANISYPIKIPAGRKGMQPQLAVQYSNEGGNGWLGQGWNLTIPAITIDTKWGVPSFDETYETEIYTLGGEQLMYPKIQNSDWMPNRQYDTPGSNFSTSPRLRIDEAVFTPRKQGSFAKIERLGISPSTYYWKVTNTNGTINWYGGKVQAEPNAVIKNADQNIVHWALFLTEDVYGNEIKYTYTNTTIPNQTTTPANANLNNGKIFYIKNILYTGYKGHDGDYQVEFNYQIDPHNGQFKVKEDASINARLGVKQVDAYLLDNINVINRALIDSNRLIRQYKFNFESGRFKKQQLVSIVELNGSGVEFYRHTFKYYNDIPNEGNNVFFSTGIDVNTCNIDNDPIDEDPDGDGVPSSEDGCPNEPGPITNNGCPVIVPEVARCYSVTFPVPLTDITYQYIGGFHEQSTACTFTPTRVKSFKIDGAIYTLPTPNNLFINHYNIDYGGITNMCNSSTWFYHLENPYLKDELSSYLNTNFSNLLRHDFLAVPHCSVNYYDYFTALNISFLSQQNNLEFAVEVESTDGNGTAFSSLGFSDNLVPYIYSGTDIPTPITVNGTPLLSGGQFSLSSNPNPFINAFQQIYPEAEISLNNYQIGINIPSTTIPPSIIVGNQSYAFTNCKGEQEFKNSIPSVAKAPELQNKLLTEKIKEKAIKKSTKKEKDYSAFYKSQSGTYSYTFDGTFPIGDPDCPSYLNYDFLIQGYIPSFDSAFSSLGSSVTEAENTSAYIGVGIGCKWYTKSSTFGYQWTFSKDKSTAKIAMTDINGDGLDDIVINEDGVLFYKAHQLTRTYDENNMPILTHSFGNRRLILGIDNFYRSRGESKSGNFQVTYGIKKFGGFLGKDKAKSEAKTSIYFTDSNGDGLIDIVKNGVVYFNRLDANNNPEFISDSQGTENLVIVAEPLSVNEPADTDTDINPPSYDVVKVWEAPADGNIKIDNTIELTDPTKAATATIEMKIAANSSCPDNDHDGVCDADDLCPDIAGSIQNNGCLYCGETSINYPIQATRYKYHIDSGYNACINNGSDCLFSPFKVISASINTISFLPPTSYFLTHYINGTGITNLCPATANPLLANDYSIQNTHFSTDIEPWLKNTVFSGYLDVASNLTVTNNSAIHYPSASSTPAYFSTFSVEFESNQNITELNINSQFADPVTGNASGIPSGINAEYFNIGGSSVSVPVPFIANATKIVLSANSSVPVSFNGQALGNFDLQNNFNSLITALHNTFGVTVEILSPNNPVFDVNVTNLTGVKYIKISNSQTPVTTITVAGVDYIFQSCKTIPEGNNRTAAGKNKSNSLLVNDATTCTGTPGDLSLLFGTTLNSTNRIVNKQFPESSSSTLSVKKGDRIYFRLHSIATGNPPVLWNPKIEYTDPSVVAITDQNNIPIYKSNYSDGFILSGNQPVSFPGNQGTATIYWTPFEVNNPSDDVTFEVHRINIKSIANDNDIVDDTVIYRQKCLANTNSYVSYLSGTALTNTYFLYPEHLFNIDMGLPPNSNPDIEAEDKATSSNQFYFKVISSSNVKWKDYDWKPRVQCTTVTKVIGENGAAEGTVTGIENLYPVADYSIYKSYPCSSPYSLLNTSSLNGSNRGIKASLDNIFFAGDTGKIWFVVKSNNELVGKRLVTINNGVTSFDIDDPIPLGSGDSNIEIGFYKDDSSLLDDQTSLLNKLATATHSLARITYASSYYDVPSNKINLFQQPNPKFGPMLRQWGQFMYSPELVQGATATAYGNLIKESVLVYTQAQASTINTAINNLPDENSPNAETLLDNFENSNAALANPAFLIATPGRSSTDTITFDERWTGQHQECYAKEYSSRAATMEQSFSPNMDGEEYENQAVLETGSYAIDKVSRGKNKNFSGGASFSSEIGIQAGGNFSKTLSGDNISVTDYIDFNGDRYPDIVTSEKVQFTNRTGGLKTPNDRSGNITQSHSSGWGIGASGSYSKGGNGASKGGHVRFEGFRGNSGGGLSGNFSKGKSITDSFWTDVNGDGLADLLTKDNGNNVTVSLNLGYKNETTNYSWNLGSATGLFESNSSNISGGIGVNKWNGSLEAGISLTSAWNSTQNTLIDLNGDGLLDYVSTDNGINVMLNEGNKFVPFGQQWSTQDMKRESVTVGATANLGATFALVWTIPFLSICLKIPAVNLSRSLASNTTNKTKKLISDFDGDGYPDLIESTGNNVKVYSSNIRRTGMLESVTNPLGGKFTIDYKVQKVDYNNPHAKWVMSDLLIEDGYDKVNDGEDHYKKHFVYQNGKYDRREREFYGYATVKSIDYTLNEDGTQGPAYRTSVSKYFNNSYFLNGLLKEAYICKGEDETLKYSRTENFYKIYGLDITNNNLVLTSSLPLSFDVGGSEGRRSAAVLLTKTKNYLYELSPTPQLTTMVKMAYDEKGRVKTYSNLGNIADAFDDYISTIDYHDEASLIDKNIISVPKSIKVASGTNTYRTRSTIADPDTGSITSIMADIDNSAYATTTMQYDMYGNLEEIVYPPNANGESMSYNYVYDTTYFKYVEEIDDAFGYSSTAKYDPNLDKIIRTRDLAGNDMNYSYDSFGRNTIILAPKERENNLQYTIKFDYYPKWTDLPDNLKRCIGDKPFMPFAQTNHYDPQHPTNDIMTISFVDGLGRAVQVKKDIQVNTGTIKEPQYEEQMSVSGKVWYDPFGRTIKQYHPYFEAKDCTVNLTLNEYDSPYFSSTEYDELDRPVKSIDPALHESTVTYSIEADNFGTVAIKTSSDVDQDGSQHILTNTYKDVAGKVISTMNSSDSNGDIWTQFKYNAIGELMSYTDADQITTSYKYDTLGRKIKVEHPDNGTTTFEYDNAGNLKKLQTENLANDASLDPANRFIKYNYDYNRLKEIIYPDAPSGLANISNVHYVYGTNGNDKGRLVKQFDATGQQAFRYGNMGELIYNRRIVIQPNVGATQYTTLFSYDSWNRLSAMSYPDGEKVTYSYDLGGNLRSVKGQLESSDYSYIKRIDYDYYEQRTYLKYGNNTETFYSYTPELRRLINLNVKTADQQDLFNNNYSYDYVGNVKNIENIAPITNNQMGGSYSHSFTYDNLNRLHTATGDFSGSEAQIEFGNDFKGHYDLEMEYNSTHAITRKRQYHTKNATDVVENSYDNTYKYQNESHKLQDVTNNSTGDIQKFKYDKNGNLIDKHLNDDQGTGFIWDESNRLRVIANGKKMQHYIYDASGERVMKASSETEEVYGNGSLLDSSATLTGYTLYPSAFLVVDTNGIYSKHYYAGSQRIVSRLGGTSEQFNIHCETCKQDPEDNKLKQTQIDDLQRLAKKAGIDKVVFKEIKALTYEEATKPASDEEGSTQRPDPNDPPRVDTGAIYYYHPDHLGTSTFLTDANGNAYQFFLNLPFGETMAEQRPTDYYVTPYKFTGKELDEETGLYYYGARYYDPKVSNWLSVDPMAEKAPNISPYIYCEENPINLADPDGRWPWPSWGSVKAYAKGFVNSATAMGIHNLVPIVGVYKSGKTAWSISKDVYNGNYASAKAKAYDATGIPGVISTVKKASHGDAEAIGSLSVIAVAALATKGSVSATESAIAKSTIALESGTVGVEASKTGGLARAAQYSESWNNASLSEAINKFAPNAEGFTNTTGKTIYNNAETGIQIVNDNNGGYFRIEDTNVTGKRSYLDMEGNIPNNKTVNGKQMGRSQAEYNQVTHFNNTDN